MRHSSFNSEAGPFGPRRRERLLVLLGILLLLAGLKAAFDPGLGRNSLDGDYYFQIARHVAEGEGLMTSVSLYHQGIRELPHRTNASPAWPLVMGYAARIIGLERAALVLPEFLFLLDLLLVYALANRLVRGASGSVYGPSAGVFAPDGVIDTGHLAVLILGLNPVFFRFTSLPYTEALAFLFLFATLLTLDRAIRGGSRAAAFGAGLLAAAGFLTRYQLVGLLVAGTIAAAVVDLHRRRIVGVCLPFVAGVIVPLGLWLAYLSTWIEPFGWRVLFGGFKGAPEVGGFPLSVAIPSAGELVLDRLRGLSVAFTITEENSYFTSFGWSVFLVPLALVQVLVDRLRRGHGRSPASARQVTLAAVTLLSGLLVLVPVHNTHARFFKEWLFGFRHGLPMILLICVSLAFLLARPRSLSRYLALLLVALGMARGSAEVGELLGRPFHAGLSGAEVRLVAWLDNQSPRPAVVTTNAQPLSAYSRAGFHWMNCSEDSARTMELLDYTSADYVLRYTGEERCPFLRGLDGRLEVVREFEYGGSAIAVLGRPRDGGEEGGGDDGAIDP